jgi:hypothetical protein
MFNFVGQVMVLQPDAELTFVGGEGYHPMLPPGPGLFLVREPSVLRTMQCDVARVAAAVQSCADAITAGEGAAWACWVSGWGMFALMQGPLRLWCRLCIAMLEREGGMENCLPAQLKLKSLGDSASFLSESRMNCHLEDPAGRMAFSTACKLARSVQPDDFFPRVQVDRVVVVLLMQVPRAAAMQWRSAHPPMAVRARRMALV